MPEKGLVGALRCGQSSGPGAAVPPAFLRELPSVSLGRNFSSMTQLNQERGERVQDLKALRE